jgi:hypothetical protein
MMRTYRIPDEDVRLMINTLRLEAARLNVLAIVTREDKGNAARLEHSAALNEESCLFSRLAVLFAEAKHVSVHK